MYPSAKVSATCYLLKTQYSRGKTKQRPQPRHMERQKTAIFKWDTEHSISQSVSSIRRSVNFCTWLFLGVLVRQSATGVTPCESMNHETSVEKLEKRLKEQPSFCLTKCIWAHTVDDSLTERPSSPICRQQISIS